MQAAHQLQAVGHTGEAIYSLAHGFRRNASQVCQGAGSQNILQIMLAAQLDALNGEQGLVGMLAYSYSGYMTCQFSNAWLWMIDQTP